MHRQWPFLPLLLLSMFGATAQAGQNFRLSLTLSDPFVYPDKTPGNSQTSVTAQLTTNTGAPAPGKMILFSASPQEWSGSHNHAGGRPVGGFDSLTCATTAAGTCSVTYSASEIGGIELIQGLLAEDSTVTASAEVVVRVSNLSEFPDGSPFYRLTGQTSAHPSNHFLIGKAGITRLVRDFYDEFSATLGLNDMSLPSGGLFDIGPTPQYPRALFWNKPHVLHREGLSVDIDRCAQSAIDDNPTDQGTCLRGWIRVPKYRIEELCNAAGGHIEVEAPIHCEFNPQGLL